MLSAWQSDSLARESSCLARDVEFALKSHRKSQGPYTRRQDRGVRAVDPVYLAAFS